MDKSTKPSLLHVSITADKESNMTKYKIMGVAIALLVLIASTSTAYYFYEKYQSALLDVATLSESKILAEQEIQQQNNELGVARSRLLTQDELDKKYRDEIKILRGKLADVDGSRKVKPVSRDKTVVAIGSTVKGGETKVTPVADKISYDWVSVDKRFKLVDPDIYTKNNEEFSYETSISIKGYILADKTGKLKARQIDVQEVVKNKDGEYVPTDSHVKIVSNDFEYIVEQPQKKLLDILNPRLQFQFDTLMNPGLAVEIGNVGNYFDWINLGVNAQTSIHVSEGVAGLQKSAVGVGVSYSLIRPLLDTNVSIGVGLLTPVSDVGNQWILNASVGFYLTN